jgi:hypothetical protein
MTGSIPPERLTKHPLIPLSNKNIAVAVAGLTPMSSTTPVSGVSQACRA